MKQHEEMLKSCGTITPFEVIDLKCFKYEKYQNLRITIKEKILFLPGYFKKKYLISPLEFKHFDEGKLNKILSAYPYIVEYISEKELEDKILNNEDIYFLNLGFEYRYLCY